VKGIVVIFSAKDTTVPPMTEPPLKRLSPAAIKDVFDRLDPQSQSYVEELQSCTTLMADTWQKMF
jgi:hypothetical protein